MGLAFDDSLHLDLGPEHPSRTGLLLASVETDGEQVTACRIQPGYNHRSAEKLFEARDYRQLLMLADRHDWHSPFSGELGAALVCEHLMGLVPPLRASWLRMLLAEQARVASNLAHLSFVARRLDQDSPVLQTRLRALRKECRELTLAASGNRVHPMLNRLGGLAGDLDADLLASFGQWFKKSAEVAAELDERLAGNGLGAGLGVIDEAVVNAFGLSGPVAQAVGLPRELRLSNPYLCYGELADELRAALGSLPQQGDAQARFQMLCRQVELSARIAQRMLVELEAVDGPVDTKLSKIIKIPESEAYLAIEAPWGMAGFHLVSRAERTPWRLKLRTPSFANVQALEAVLPGTPLDELEVVVASLGWTNGDLDK